MSKYHVALLAILLILAGCPSNTQTSNATEVTNPETNTIDTGNEASSSATIVAVEPGPLSQKQAVAISKASASFWEGKDGGDIRPVSVRPNATNPDVIFRFQSTITSCNNETTPRTFSYCWETGDPGSVRVATPYTDSGVENVSKIAMGEYLGIDDPESHAGVTSLEDVEYSDPWLGPEPVTVRINNTANESRNLRPVVNDALNYWEENDSKYGTYTTNFSLQPDADTADVEIRFVDNITSCPAEDGHQTLGCAPIYNSMSYEANTTIIEIKKGYTEETTLATLKHEFGHVYGLEHGMEPMPVMNESNNDATRLPMEDATERTYPWQNEKLYVHIDYGSFDSSKSSVRTQVQYALEYYEDEANNQSPSDLQFELTESNQTANISIAASRNPCGDGDAGSCGLVYGSDPDGDRALEFYNRQEILLKDIDIDAMGWHVGYWLGFSIASADDRSELPKPFQDADYDDRRDWHEDY